MSTVWRSNGSTRNSKSLRRSVRTFSGCSCVWTGADSCVEVAYFTSEADARAGEQAPVPEDMQKMMTEFQEMNQNTEFFDLTDPQIH